MGKITLDLLRKRAEHNDGMLSNLKEITLHQQNIERIELIGDACRELGILYLQNNVIGKIENLYHLKALQYLNLAMNNIVRIENLQGCESLQKLDLTMNFIPVSALASFANLSGLYNFRELHLLGNPCQSWEQHRGYIMMMLPQLQSLDGIKIPDAEQDKIGNSKEELQTALQQYIQNLPYSHSEASSEKISSSENNSSGEMKRPWCPEVRLAEHREQEQLNIDAEERRRLSQSQLLTGTVKKPVFRYDFPPLPEAGDVKQTNEGRWDYTFEDEAACIELKVCIGRGVLTEQMKVEVHPHLVRLLIKGKLLQLEVPEEVNVAESLSQRSKTNGDIVILMPKLRPTPGCLSKRLGHRKFCEDIVGTASDSGQASSSRGTILSCWEDADALPPIET